MVLAVPVRSLMRPRPNRRQAAREVRAAAAAAALVPAHKPNTPATRPSLRMGATRAMAVVARAAMPVALLASPVMVAMEAAERQVKHALSASSHCLWGPQ